MLGHNSLQYSYLGNEPVFFIIKSDYRFLGV